VSDSRDEQLHYPRVVALVRDMPWALLPSKLAAILDLIRFRADGFRLTAEEIRERIGHPRACDMCDDDDPLFRIGAAPPRVQPSAGGVAVLPIFGVIVQRADMFTEVSGGASTERIASQFRQAVNDPNVGAVVLQIDSPGGGVYGVAELADTILKARGSKPIIAVADSLAASAAYWIAASADEIVVTPSGEVGSIGVYTAHEDLSRLLDAEGVTISLIAAGKYKTEGNPFEPLGEEARAAIQARVDDYYSMFVRSVAKGRDVKLDGVRNGFGQGRVVGAQEAVKLGMADRIDTLEATVSRLAGRSGRASNGRADDPSPEIAAGPGINLRRRRLRLAQH